MKRKRLVLNACTLLTFLLVKQATLINAKKSVKNRLNVDLAVLTLKSMSFRLSLKLFKPTSFIYQINKAKTQNSSVYLHIKCTFAASKLLTVCCIFCTYIHTCLQLYIPRNYCVKYINMLVRLCYTRVSVVSWHMLAIYALSLIKYQWRIIN